ncbi:unnamed protein product [Protopolystoma xenopodis]|uniref:Uncharacterized protein n=1 Tax=Protopolystoma xenopodis TaxID=117903 RepID=A0A448WBJ0_9PLAT|nr:unnamed protein product [Protopolystoma xenopodis]
MDNASRNQTPTKVFDDVTSQINSLPTSHLTPPLFPATSMKRDSLRAPWAKPSESQALPALVSSGTPRHPRPHSPPTLVTDQTVIQTDDAKPGKRYNSLDQNGASDRSQQHSRQPVVTDVTDCSSHKWSQESDSETNNISSVGRTGTSLKSTSIRRPNGDFTYVSKTYPRNVDLDATPLHHQYTQHMHFQYSSQQEQTQMQLSHTSSQLSSLPPPPQPSLPLHQQQQQTSRSHPHRQPSSGDSHCTGQIRYSSQYPHQKQAGQVTVVDTAPRSTGTGVAIRSSSNGASVPAGIASAGYTFRAQHTQVLPNASGHFLHRPLHLTSEPAYDSGSSGDSGLGVMLPASSSSSSSSCSSSSSGLGSSSGCCTRATVQPRRPHLKTSCCQRLAPDFGNGKVGSSGESAGHTPSSVGLANLSGTASSLLGKLGPDYSAGCILAYSELMAMTEETSSIGMDCTANAPYDMTRPTGFDGLAADLDTTITTSPCAYTDVDSGVDTNELKREHHSLYTF